MTELLVLVREALEESRVSRYQCFAQNDAALELLELGADALTPIENGVRSLAVNTEKTSGYVQPAFPGLASVMVSYFRLIREHDEIDRSIRFMSELAASLMPDALTGINIVWGHAERSMRELPQQLQLFVETLAADATRPGEPVAKAILRNCRAH